MQIRREGITQGAGRFEAEQLEERLVGIGQAAGRVAPENGVALRIHQALVADLALIEPRVRRGGVAQGIFQPLRRGAHFIRLLPQHGMAFARIENIGNQKGQGHGQQGAEAGGGHDGQPAGQHDVAHRDHEHQARNRPEHDPDQARQRHVVCFFPFSSFAALF
jgi:hypothetical protein